MRERARSNKGQAINTPNYKTDDEGTISRGSSSSSKLHRAEMMLTPLWCALQSFLKAPAISRRDGEHISPAFDSAGDRLGSLD